jgi:hypothetical protein
MPFHDGLRCIGGSVYRWSPQTASPVGVTSYGPGLAAHAAANFPAAFQFLAATTWNFQAWYRNPLGPCGTGSNLSSSGMVVFTP